MTETGSGHSHSVLRKLTGQWRYLVRQDGFHKHPIAILARLVVWRLRTLFHLPSVIRFRHQNLRMFLPGYWRGTAKIIYTFRDQYDRELRFLASYLSTGSVFVDVGANYGIYSLFAARSVGENGRVLAFEPAGEAYRVLNRNVELNRLTNTTVVRAAASDRKGQVPLYLHADSSRNALGSTDQTQAYELVDTITLDEALTVHGLASVSTIKIDVEGAEELVLRGGTGLFAEAAPVVVFEVNPEGAESLGLSPTGAWDLLAEHGYEFYTVNADGGLDRITAQPSGGNVIAVRSA